MAAYFERDGNIDLAMGVSGTLILMGRGDGSFSAGQTCSGCIPVNLNARNKLFVSAAARGAQRAGGPGPGVRAAAMHAEPQAPIAVGLLFLSRTCVERFCRALRNRLILAETDPGGRRQMDCPA